MDTYADDLAALFEALDLNDAILVGHSTGGGEVTRYIGRHRTSRVAKAVLLGAIPPLMLKTDANPEGTPIEAFDEIRAGVSSDRSQFYEDLSAPFYGANRDESSVSQGTRDAFWMWSMQVGFKGASTASRLLRDGSHGGSEEDRRSDPGRARRRRPDRVHRRGGGKVVDARPGLHPEGLPRRPQRPLRRRPVRGRVQLGPDGGH
jgi:pimeloyl-ACP methyl ester carboxylesterase